ncbi:MAG: membrane protein insertase YidC, partial [Rhodobacteraceae bacterium]|nr:membrane protein insertase YidC [Paracoccaceae bacterium]
MDEQNRNLILATALSFLVVLTWFLIFPPEAPPPSSEVDGAPAVSTDLASTPPAAGAPEPGASTPSPGTTVSTAPEVQRIPVATDHLTGSISLLGGRIDDLSLTDYRETLADDSDIVHLLTPAGQDHAYYALHGWAPAGALDFADVPNANTVWQIESGERLAPGNPVALVWENGSGLTFRRTLSIDSAYMITVTQSVQNGGNIPVRLAPYGIIARHGEPADQQNFFILHEGVVGMKDGELHEIDYSKVPKLNHDNQEQANLQKIDVQENGWIGFTDKYWMTTLIPEPGQRFTAVTKYSETRDIYQTETRLPVIEVYPQSAASTVSRLFAGAKEWSQIRAYEQGYGIERFVDSIDWGWFFFLTKPIFIVLHWLNSIIGNMGWSIICLTLIIKAFLFPLAYKSYVSMARMKELQPEMEKIRERVGDDRKRMQAEMMTMYKEKKINPAAGCLPLLPQIPIFFSLYKVIFVTIELRHAPFIFWINDLSAPDPTSILNLFGALPWGTPDPGSLVSLISLGVLPILLGISMWLQQKLNPAPTDPTQAMVFAWLPWVFMFMLGQFASGLILYWIANNVITFIQQYAIMRSQNIKPDIWGNIRSGFERRKK